METVWVPFFLEACLCVFFFFFALGRVARLFEWEEVNNIVTLYLDLRISTTNPLDCPVFLLQNDKSGVFKNLFFFNACYNSHIKLPQ